MNPPPVTDNCITGPASTEDTSRESYDRYGEDPATGRNRELVLGATRLSCGQQSDLGVQRLLLPAGETPLVVLKAHTIGLNLGATREVAYSQGGPYRREIIHPGNASFFAKGNTVGARWTEAAEIALVTLDEDERELSATWQDSLTLHSAQTERIVRQMIQETEAKDYGYELAMSSLSNLLRVELQRQMRRPSDDHRGKESLTPAQRRRVLDYIQANLNGPLRLEDLAGLVELSTAHFARAFRHSVGLPPARYVRKQRVEAASRMLRDNNLPLQEIALRLGFASPSHFAEQFRQHTGLTPRQFRREGASRSQLPDSPRIPT